MVAGRDPRFAELDRRICAEPARRPRRGQRPSHEELLDDLNGANLAAGAIPEPERGRRRRAIALAIELNGKPEGRRLIPLIMMSRWCDLYAEADEIEKRMARARILEQRAACRVYAVRRRQCEQLSRGASA